MLVFRILFCTTLKICEGCLSRFYADISSLRLIRNLQYLIDVIKEIWYVNIEIILQKKVNILTNSFLKSKTSSACLLSDHFLKYDMQSNMNNNTCKNGF